MLDLVNLTKEYRDLRAVDNLNLHLEPGEIFGFIGPNGAGKTTTIKMIATLLRPTAGEAYVNGINVAEKPEQVRSLIGYMPDFFGVYEDVKVWEYLDFFAAAYRIPKAQRPPIIDDVLALTDLTVKKDSFVEELSRGMKQRLCLAKTLVHEPQLLLLDEPASGLNAVETASLAELLGKIRDSGVTLLLVEHDMNLVMKISDRVFVLNHGMKLAEGTPCEVQANDAVISAYLGRDQAGRKCCA